MNHSEYLEYCQDVYKAELDETEAFYRRFPMAITAAAVILSGCTYLLSGKYVQQVFTRIDVFLYYLFAFASCIAVCGGLVLLVLALSARKYKLLPSLPSLADFRTKSELYFRTQTPAATTEEVQAYLARETASLILDQTIEAQGINRRVNASRRAYFNWCMRLLALALLPLLGQSIMYSVIQVRAMSNGTQQQLPQPAAAADPSATTAPAA